VATAATKSGPLVEAWGLISPVDGQPDGFIFFSSCLFFQDNEYCGYYVGDTKHHHHPEPLSRIEKLFPALLYWEFCEKFLHSSNQEAKEWLAQTANAAWTSQIALLRSYMSHHSAAMPPVLMPPLSLQPQSLW
jgi:hypothetical protein